MATVHVNDIELDYQVFGDAADPALLLISGLGGQRITWPGPLIDGLVQRGLRVVTFDNRDVGASTILDHLPFTGADLAGVAAQHADAPYALADMAADAAGLLDHLGIVGAHIVGVSMGGMIAQHLAFSHPARVLTLTCIMSTTGAPDVGQSTPEASALLFRAPPRGRDAFITTTVARRRSLGSPTMFDDAATRELAGRVFDRGLHPAGSARQLAAIFADGDRTERLAAITAPTLVVHGAVDPLVDVSGGRAIAAAIPGAELLILDDMGHDLPAPLLPTIVDRIAEHTASEGDAGEQAPAA